MRELASRDAVVKPMGRDPHSRHTSTRSTQTTRALTLGRAYSRGLGSSHRGQQSDRVRRRLGGWRAGRRCPQLGSGRATLACYTYRYSIAGIQRITCTSDTEPNRHTGGNAAGTEKGEAKKRGGRRTTGASFSGSFAAPRFPKRVTFRRNLKAPPEVALFLGEGTTAFSAAAA